MIKVFLFLCCRSPCPRTRTPCAAIARVARAPSTRKEFRNFPFWRRNFRASGHNASVVKARFTRRSSARAATVQFSTWEKRSRSSWASRTKSCKGSAVPPGEQQYFGQTKADFISSILNLIYSCTLMKIFKQINNNIFHNKSFLGI